MSACQGYKSWELHFDAQAPSEHVSRIWSQHHPSPKHAEIVATAPDTWVTLPKGLDPRFRNPCWKDGSTQRLRCMPYYQVIGVSKCGTTDMFNRLRRHPDMAAGSKGPHFWDECPSPPRSACTAPPNGDFDGYVDLFKKGAEQIAENPEAICGEASSNTYTGVYTYVRRSSKEPFEGPELFQDQGGVGDQALERL
ncbi:MAG: hypothetical protein WDW38_009575 [Sanguina aurantia]